MTHPMFWMSEANYSREEYDEAVTEYEVANICADTAAELRAAGFWRLADEVEASNDRDCAQDAADFISGTLA